MRVYLLFSLFMAAGTGHEVQAEVLSWDECVRLVARNNSALESSRQAYLSSQETTRSSVSAYLPSLSGSASYSHSITSLTPTSPSYVADSYSTSLNLSQNLFNGLNDQAKINQNEANEGVALNQLQTTKALVSYNLKSAYEGLLYSQELLVLSREITERREQNLRLVELRFKDGRENRGSVLLYQAYYKDAKYSELLAKDGIDRSKVQLAQALGLDEFESLSVKGEVPVHEVESDKVETLALNTPNYLQAYYQEKVAEAAVTIARAGFFPTLSLSGSEGLSGPSWFPQNQRFAVGLSLNVPLFDGGRDLHGTRAALDSEKAASLTLRDTLRQMVSQLLDVRFKFVEAIEKLNVDTSYLEAAKVRAEIARANYKNGLLSFQDWDLAETDLITRETNQLSSKENRVIAEAAWEQAQGKGVIP